ALLIQGSTCIYSKKVEYLYLLLYQTLDFLIERKKQRTSVDKEGNDRDVAEFEEKETEFLTLDDIEGSFFVFLAALLFCLLTRLQTCFSSAESDNIDLVESPHRRMETRLKEYALTRAPLALMPLSAEEGVSDGTRRTDFRMNTCAVHPSGALLLEDEDKLSGKNSIWENNGSSTNQQHNKDHTNVEFEVGGLRRSHIGDDDDDDVQEDLTDDDEEIDEEEAKRRAEAAKNAQEGEGSTVMAQLRERMENDGGGFVATNAQQQQQGQDSSTTTRKKLMEKERITEEHEEPVHEDPVDYWATLNPHLNELQERPLKKGKTWKLPESLGGPSASTKRKRGSKDKPPPSSEESNKMEDEQEQEQEDVCSLRSVRGPYLPEFKYLYALEMKRRLNARKQVRESKHKKKKGGVEIFYGYEEEEEEIQQMSAAHQQVELVDGLDRFEQIEQDYMASNNLASGGSSSAAASSSGDNAVPFDDYGHDFGFPTAADDDDDDDVDDGLLPMHSSFSSANGDGAPPPMALDDGGTDWMGSNYSAASAGGIEHCESYEDLCRRHIENYLSSAEAFAVETSLSKRVGQWKSKLEPILEEQSLHPNFDIHDYGERILERFPVRKMVPPREQQQEDDPQADEEEERQGVVVGFESLVDGDEVYEVCRKFAAILQLANNGNIDIIRPQRHDRMISGGEQQDSSTGVGPLDHGIKLRLLSSIPLTFESVDSISLETVQGEEAEVEQNGPSSRRKASDKRKRTEEEEDGEEEEDELSEEEEEEQEEERPQKNTRKKGAKGKRKGSKEQASSKTKKQETTKPNGNKKERARVAQLEQDNKENEEDRDHNERRSTAATTSNKSKPTTTARTATTAAARRRDKGKEKVYDDIPSPASRSVRQPFALVNC
ncbi:Condensin-2 complex subunit H2, partial [Balamuthia mandrillaris]